MTLAALKMTDAEPVALDVGDWLSLSDVAQRTGKDAGHLRRLCSRKWQQIGLARMEDGQWLVHTSAVPQLRRTATNESARDVEFQALRHEVRTKAMQRAQCVAAFRAAKDEPGAFKVRLPGLIQELRRRFPALGISRGTLYRWDTAAGHRIDPMELVDLRKLTKTDGGDVSLEAIAFFREVYLEQRKPSIRSCHERTAEFAARHGYTWCESYHQARRIKKKIIDKQTELQHRDPAKYRSTCEPWIERDPESFAANECWVSDHRPLDVLCYTTDEEGKQRTFRPYLTVWMDWRTRYILGWVLVENPNTASILAALKMALLNPICAGPPRYVWIDNGKDFDSYTLQGMTKVQRRKADREVLLEGEQTHFPGVFGLLHIEPHHSIPYRGQGKARCERFFATVAERFDKTFPTYTGKDTTRKPEDLSMHIAAGRAPFFDDLRDRLSAWIDGHNQAADHSIADLSDAASRLSRHDAYAGWSTPAVMPDTQTIDLVCYKWPAPPAQKGKPSLGRKVGRNGVSVTIGGSTVRFGDLDDALRPFKATDRQVVVCYDPADLNQLYVFDEHMALVTVAQRNVVIGRYGSKITEDQLKAASRDRASYQNALKVRRQHRQHEYLSAEEVAADKARQQPAEPTATRKQDGGVRLVQTRIDDAAKQAKKAQQRLTAKVAGGGEVECEPAPTFVYTSIRVRDEEEETAGFDFHNTMEDEQ